MVNRYQLLVCTCRLQWRAVINSCVPVAQRCSSVSSLLAVNQQIRQLLCVSVSSSYSYLLMTYGRLTLPCVSAHWAVLTYQTKCHTNCYNIQVYEKQDPWPTCGLVRRRVVVWMWWSSLPTLKLRLRSTRHLLCSPMSTFHFDAALWETNINIMNIITVLLLVLVICSECNEILLTTSNADDLSFYIIINYSYCWMLAISQHTVWTGYMTKYNCDNTIYKENIPSTEWARKHCRISPSYFLPKCCKMQLNQGSFVLLYFALFAFWRCI